MLLLNATEVGHKSEQRQSGENRNMAKGTLKDLVRLAKIWRMPLALMILCFKDERKGSKNDAEALESLIENLAEGSIS